ncbi:MAG TPA: hypothetical protein VGH05_11805 [Buttiauxella sp.]|jgi:hypothetical protein
MLQQYFVSDNVQSAIQKYREVLSEYVTDSDFSNNRNMHIRAILTAMQSSPQTWDASTQFNVNNIGPTFLRELAVTELNEISLNFTFTSCFRFLLEKNIKTPEEMVGFLKKMQDFAIYRASEFDETNCDQINYALKEMPIAIIKEFINGEQVKGFTDLETQISKAEEMKNEWFLKLDEKQNKIDEMNAELKRQEYGFNFVGLYAGFAKLGKIKSGELNWAKKAVFILGALLPMPLIIEMIYLLRTKNAVYNIEHLIKTIPILSITFILIYYFRVALNNYSSVRAQVMQIELRKSLCRFIQSYAEYAKDIKTKDNDILSKFEDVIFSNIMASEEKTPSTFDGIEQIAGLLSALKNPKDKK